MSIRKNLLWIAALMLVAVIQKCRPENEPAAPRPVQFTFNLSGVNPENGRTHGLADATELLLSLETASGGAVFTSKHIGLLHVGSSLMTEPVELLPGSYQIIDFMLIDNHGNVLYATPKAGSPLASSVTHPLPVSFSVSSSTTSTIDMEVVNVSTSQPEDFGYASFNITVVDPAFTMVAVVDGGIEHTEFQLGGTGRVRVNWGDGIIDTAQLEETASSFFQHDYPSNGNFKVTVTGNLAGVDYFYHFYDNGRFDSIQFVALPNLKEIRLGLTHTSPVIDLSGNKQLEYALIQGLFLAERIILPDSSHINFIDISGPNLLPVSNVDEIIDRVYQSAVLHHTTGGAFIFHSSISSQGTMLGPPSIESQLKLIKLRDEYHWVVLPDPWS